MDPGRWKVCFCCRGWLQAKPVWFTGPRYWQRNHQLQHRYIICQPRQQDALNSVKDYKFLCLNRQNFESQTKRHTALSFYAHNMWRPVSQANFHCRFTAVADCFDRRSTKQIDKMCVSWDETPTFERQTLISFFLHKIRSKLNFFPSPLLTYLALLSVFPVGTFLQFL